VLLRKELSESAVNNSIAISHLHDIARKFIAVGVLLNMKKQLAD